MCREGVRYNFYHNWNRLLIIIIHLHFKTQKCNLSTKRGYFVIVQIYEYVANH